MVKSTKNPVVSSFEAKTHLAQLLRDVERGERIVITRRGKPVASLIPYEKQENKMSLKDIILEFRNTRNSIKKKINIKEYIKEGRKR